MKYNVTLNNKVYEVEVEKGEAILVNVADVQVAAPVAAPVAAAPVAAAPAPAAAPAGAALSGEVITAQMPGTILKVNVNAGDQVKSGQVLVVMEAMKMEIEVVAPRDGQVAQVAAAKGAAVDTGAPLLSLA